MPLGIDLHCHIFPPEYLRIARSDGERIGASIYRRDDGQEYLRAPGDFDYPLLDELWSVPALVRKLGERSLAGAALSVAPPTLCYWADPGLAADVSAANNDSIAEVVRGAPDRFVGLCTVPLQDTARAIRELERAMRLPGMRGVLIASHVGEKNLDHADMIAFLEACQAADACVFVHPYDVLGRERLQNYYMWNLIGMVTETAVAIESLIFGGVYERLPRLRTYFAHAGGSYPWLMGRAEHGFKRLITARFGTDQPPSAFLDRVFVDSMIYLPSALRWLIGEIGSDHVVVGSDYPFDIGPDDPTAIVREAKLGATDAENVLYRTAWKLLGVEVGARHVECAVADQQSRKIVEPPLVFDSE